MKQLVTNTMLIILLFSQVLQANNEELNQIKRRNFFIKIYNTWTTSNTKNEVRYEFLYSEDFFQVIKKQKDTIKKIGYIIPSYVDGNICEGIFYDSLCIAHPIYMQIKEHQLMIKIVDYQKDFEDLLLIKKKRRK